MQVPNHPTITTNGALRPTQVYVDLEKISGNYHTIQKHVGDSIVMPILKANAYGHGLIEVAKHIVKQGANILGVAFLEEALLLRESGVENPILVLGGVLGNQVPTFIQHDLTLTASSVEKLQQIDEVAARMRKKAKVHLKIDTGMERIGVHYYSATPLLQASLGCKHTIVEGIFSHFANADAADLTSSRLQVERFHEVLKFYQDRSLPTPIRHMANSGAILQLPESYLDMVRPGIILYGVYPSHDVRKTIPISPALSWHTRVVYFKVVKPGHPVSYGSTWQTDHLTRVVTIPVGYGDGYFRSMSGKAEVLIRGNRYPTIGRICMDQVMVNIEWETAYNNDEVILIGNQGDEKITCEDLARWADTIPYEILTNINTRVPRIYQTHQ
ncbi:MAG: alanine racemase [Anaerolineales bacterium]|nr:alanine racemase [Anaerolineales bacterium]